jgi:quercetin dioxygenase-like cupin family protein
MNYFGLNFIATGSETNNKFFISKTTIPSGDSGPPIHLHKNEDEYLFILKGTINVFVDQDNICLKEGDFYKISKNVPHTWYVSTDETVEMIVIFQPAGIENMFIELHGKPRNMKDIGLKYGTIFNL